MTFKNQSGCELLIPHKDWSGDSQERENYAEIERWAKRLQDCFGSCTCSVEQGRLNLNVLSDAFTQKSRNDFSNNVRCGVTSNDHAFLTVIDFKWAGNVAGERAAYIQGNGETTTDAGQSVPGVAGLIDGFQRMNFTHFLPSHVNTLSPKWFITMQQNSGSTLSVQIDYTEYYPCCNCDWPFPC